MENRLWLLDHIRSIAQLGLRYSNNPTMLKDMKNYWDWHLKNTPS